jgi:PAS domain S-box-containing protein
MRSARSDVCGAPRRRAPGVDIWNASGLLRLSEGQAVPAGEARRPDAGPAEDWARRIRDGALPGAVVALLFNALVGATLAGLALVGLVIVGLARGWRCWWLPLVALGVVVLDAHALTDLTLPQDLGALPVAHAIACVVEGLLIGALLTRLLEGRARGPSGAVAPADPARLRMLLDSSQQSQRRFQLLVEGVRDYAIFFVEPDGRVASWSAAAERITGYRADEVLGGPVARVQPEGAAGPLGALAIATSRGRCEGEGAYRRKDGTRIWVHHGLSALRAEDGALRGFAAVVRDISERRRAEEALQRARDELEARVLQRTVELDRANAALREAKEAAEAASRAKDRFLAILSHELRTPLTPALAAATGLLQRADAPAEARPMLETIRRGIETEARLIDDLLDLTRIAHGKLRLERRAVDVHELLDRVLEVCRLDVEAKALRVDLVLASASPFVHADPGRLQQVFWNLVKNAVKFTPAGGWLAIRTRDEDGGGSARLVVEVADGGIGIEAEDLARIFETFEQVEGSRGASPGGLGLGLAIGRGIVEAHGGRLAASSAGRGRGTTFTVELARGTAPARLAGPARRPSDLSARRAPNAPERAAPLKILLVEDDRTTLDTLERLLRWSGHEVVAQPAVAPAVACARGQRFDLLVSDIGLPDGSGWDLMRRLRAGGRSIAGIALSGHGLEDDVRRSREAGFGEHLTKPIDFRTLEEKIERMAARMQQSGPPT